MTTLFERKVSVIVGPPGEIGRKFEGFRTDFSTKMSGRSFPNKAKIEIYNLSRNSAAFVDDPGRLSIRLLAGYREPELIFQGEIRKGRATTIQNGPDRITRIEAGDGQAAYRSARIAKSWEGAVSMKRVVRDLADSFGTSVDIPATLADVQLSQGFVANGPSRDVMDDIADSLGFDWYFEFGELRIVPKDGDTGEQAVLLSSDTGLVESPEKTSKGVNGISLLNPRIRPKRIVEFRTELVKGFYRVQKLQHKGSTHGKEFYTRFEAKAIG